MGPFSANTSSKQGSESGSRIYQACLFTISSHSHPTALPSMVSPTPQLILHWSLANPIILLTPPSIDLSKEDQHQHEEEKKKSEGSPSFILSVEHIRNFQSRK